MFGGDFKRKQNLLKRDVCEREELPNVDLLGLCSGNIRAMFDLSKISLFCRCLKWFTFALNN